MLRFPAIARQPFLLSLSAITLFGFTCDSFGGKPLAHQPMTLVSSTSQGKAVQEIRATPIYNFTMDDIDGKPRPLREFKGKVMMIVNTASFCGNTPQYADLQTLYERYRDQGFTILAFPANDFGKQEPGDNKEIAEFCYTKYSLEFPLFSKITVLGDQKHPLYRYLTEDTPFKGEIQWNFQKFLVDQQGAVIARYAPGQKPLTPQIVGDIEKALQTS
ncbi:MAG: glutathione peroxidase [Nitrospirales bacterium]